MYVDPNHEGLKKYRAFRAEKKVVAIIANEYGEENPDATPQECKAAALEIREGQLQTQVDNAKRKRSPRKRKASKSTNMDKVNVVVVNKVSDES